MSRSPYVFGGSQGFLERGWFDQASCLDMSPDDFAKGDNESYPAFLKRVSGKSETLSCPPDCPVMRECALDALKYQDVDVIRAGVFLYPPRSKERFKESRSRLEEVAGLMANSD